MSLKKKVLVVVCFLFFCGFIYAGGEKEKAPAAAEPQFPKGDITVIIPAGAGGGNDLTVRALIPSLERTLKVPVVPVNQTAGKGAVAFTEVANAKPDGYKLYFHSKSVLLLKFSGIEEAKIERLAPVAQVAEDVSIFVVKADSPWKKINDLIEHVKASKQKVKAANSGIGSLWHLSQVMFEQTIGTDNMLPVAYSGSTASLTALVAGEVDVVISGPEVLPFVESGQVRMLCVVFPGRYPSLPNVPTLKEETGLDYDYPVWRGFFTTAGTDPKVIQILADALKTAVESEEYKKFTAVGMIGSYKGPQEFGKIVDDERKRLDVLMPQIADKMQQ